MLKYDNYTNAILSENIDYVIINMLKEVVAEGLKISFEKKQRNK